MNKGITPIPIEDEMKESYMTYAMSVIVSRALPDVRDGLKPVHRRILYAMNDMGIRSASQYRKSARIVGEVLGKYHPHGDQAVYQTLVRLAQDFSMRYLIVDGQGNYGSVDGDSPAAMRYTEARLTSFAMEMLSDMNKDTVNFTPNFDDSLKEPVVLPAGVPNLLLNGSTGIAVGMATNIPPHNLAEIVDAIIAMIDRPEIDVEELLDYVEGPDFPTGAFIYGKTGIRAAYRTGRGKIILRARVEEETLKRSGRNALIIHELPYQVNKAELLSKIATLAKEKKIEGIAEIRDESDRTGMRAVIELKKGVNPDLLLNQLYIHTSLQNVFGIIFLALVDKKPRILNLKELMEYYIIHRREIIVRRTHFDLDRAVKRSHIVEGLLKALERIDLVIELIRSSETVQKAQENLQISIEMSHEQAQAILEMRLQRLTILEKDKLQKEYEELHSSIQKFREILASQTVQDNLMKEELLEVKNKYADARKTQIIEHVQNIEEEDLIPKEDHVLIISHQGYIKRLHNDSYRQQLRGGQGVHGNTKEDDFIEDLFVASTHDYILFFSNLGRCFFVKVYEIPETGRTSRGRHLRLLLQLREEEFICSILPLSSFDESKAIVLITKYGKVKRCSISDFLHARTRGIRAMNLEKGNLLISAVLSSGDSELMICTKDGKALRLREKEIPKMGRNARGVIGIRLKEQNAVVSVVVVEKDRSILLLTEKGYGKRMSFDQIHVHGRATQGQKYINISEKTGLVTAVRSVSEDDEILAITSQAMVIKTLVRNISQFGKNAGGVRIVQVKKGDTVVAIARCAPSLNLEEEEES